MGVRERSKYSVHFTVSGIRQHIVRNKDSPGKTHMTMKMNLSARVRINLNKKDYVMLSMVLTGQGTREKMETKHSCYWYRVILSSASS